MGGVGQMSFVKHAIFVGEDAPEQEELTRYILDRLDIDDLMISKGVVDALDHSSPRFALGGKLGLDCTGDVVSDSNIILKDDAELLSDIQNIDSNVTDLK